MTQSSFCIDLDEVTLAGARQGDLRACEKIYRMFERPAYTLAYRICRCPDTAQEVMQDAFIAVMKRIGQYRGEAPFWAWLRRVVANYAISALRKKPNEISLELLHALPESQQQQSRLENTMDIDKALSLLSAEDRAVVWLHDVEGYNHREIGEMMNKTQSYSKSRLSRARQRLKDMMQAETGSGAHESALLKAESS